MTLKDNLIIKLLTFEIIIIIDKNLIRSFNLIKFRIIVNEKLFIIVYLHDNIVYCLQVLKLIETFHESINLKF